MFNIAKKGKKPWKKSGPTSSAPTATKMTFWVPNKGYEDFFTSGTVKDAVQSTDMIEQLLRYVSASGWKQASALAKVMTNLKNPAWIAPARPTRTYLCGSGTDAVETTNRITLGVLNIPMDDDIDYEATMDEYISKKSKYDAQLKNWEENNSKGCYLVLQHCPKELEVELRKQDSWKIAEYARSIIAILLLI